MKIKFKQFVGQSSTFWDKKVGGQPPEFRTIQLVLSLSFCIMQYKTIIANRPSIFPIQFSGKGVTDSQLHELLEAGNWTPTHRRTEPWRFKVFRGEKKTGLGRFLVEAYTNTTPKFLKRKTQAITDKIKLSDAVVLICMKRDEKESVPEWEEIAATAMAVQKFMVNCNRNGSGRVLEHASIR